MGFFAKLMGLTMLGSSSTTAKVMGGMVLHNEVHLDGLKAAKKKMQKEERRKRRDANARKTSAYLKRKKEEYKNEERKKAIQSDTGLEIMETERVKREHPEWDDMAVYDEVRRRKAGGYKDIGICERLEDRVAKFVERNGGTYRRVL